MIPRSKAVPAIERLMNRVTETDIDLCWDHNRHATNSTGHTKLSVLVGASDSASVYAHRLTYETFVGPIPPGLVVRHRCGNGRCVNPTHLTTGTQRDNVHDTIQMGKGKIGRRRSDKCSQAKMTWEQVCRARREGWCIQQVVDTYGLSKSSASSMLRGQTYKQEGTIEVEALDV